MFTKDNIGMHTRKPSRIFILISKEENSLVPSSNYLYMFITEKCNLIILLSRNILV